MKKNNFRKNIGFTLITIVLALVSLELLIAYPVYYFWKGTGHSFYGEPLLRDYKIYREDPVLGFTLEYNLNIKKSKVVGRENAPRFTQVYDIQTDENGFRYDKELETPKQNDEIRIFSLGGSTTMGGEVPNKLTYPQQLEDMLGNPKIKVINAGVGAYRSIHVLFAYKHKVKKLAPDAITIFSGWNDLMTLGSLKEGVYQPRNPHAHCLAWQFYVFKNRFGNNPILFYLFKKIMFRYSGAGKLQLPILVFSAADVQREQNSYEEAANNQVWQNEYTANIDELILEAKADGVIPILIMFPAPVFENAPQEAKDFDHMDGDGAWPWNSRLVFLKNIRALQMNLAKKHNIPIIDVNKAFDKYNDNYEEKFNLFTDDVHLSEKGNTLIAQTLLPRIKKIVQEIKIKKEHPISAN